MFGRLRFNYFVCKGVVGVHDRLQTGATLVMRAASWGYTEMVGELLDRGADPNSVMGPDGMRRVHLFGEFLTNLLVP